jgi:hypothetical protein
MSEATNSLRQELARDPEIGQYVDLEIDPPKVHRGTGKIQLVILGQDPTVKTPESRKKIRFVLNLDCNGALRTYLDRICTGLGLSLDTNVYATNFANVFFKEPPASVKTPDILSIATKYCLPNLLNELQTFPGVPILSLGEPLLEQLAIGATSRKVNEYWGYRPDWKTGATLPFRHLLANDNVLHCKVFPFPHQPSLRKEFYTANLDAYVGYMKRECCL